MTPTPEPTVTMTPTPEPTVTMIPTPEPTKKKLPVFYILLVVIGIIAFIILNYFKKKNDIFDD